MLLTHVHCLPLLMGRFLRGDNGGGRRCRLPPAAADGLDQADTRGEAASFEVHGRESLASWMAWAVTTFR